MAGMLIPLLVVGAGVALLAASSGGDKKPVAPGGGGGGKAPPGTGGPSAMNCDNAHESAKKVLGDSLYTSLIGDAVKKAKASGTPAAGAAILKSAAASIDAAALLQKEEKAKSGLTFLAGCLRADAAVLEKGSGSGTGTVGPGTFDTPAIPGTTAIPDIGSLGKGLGDLGKGLGAGGGGELLCLRDKSGAVIPDSGLANLTALGVYTPNPAATSSELSTQAEFYRNACQGKAAGELDTLAAAKKAWGM